MKTSNLSIKALAAFMGVSTDTIRRVVRKGAMPATRVGTAFWFDRHKGLTCMQRNTEPKCEARSTSPPGGESRPRAARNAPGLGTRGHFPQGSLQEDGSRMNASGPRHRPTASRSTRRQAKPASSRAGVYCSAHTVGSGWLPLVKAEKRHE